MRESYREELDDISDCLVEMAELGGLADEHAPPRRCSTPTSRWPSW